MYYFLGLEFVTGWAARGGGRRIRFQLETQRQKVKDLARDLWQQYLKEAKAKPRDALVELQKDSSIIQTCVEQILKFEKLGKLDAEFQTIVNELTDALLKIRDSIANERLLSTFEISISEVVSALLYLLMSALETGSKTLCAIFKKVFFKIISMKDLIFFYSDFF